MNYMKMICLMLLVSTLVLAQGNYDFSKEKKKKVISVDALLAYNKWQFNHKRAYLSEEEQSFRQFIFFENFKKIQDNNNDPNSTYKTGVNQFTDMTEEEFENRMLNNAMQETYENYHVDQAEDDESDKRKLQTLPGSVDWRTQGVVTPVKNQGSCGSCYTFSATGVLESVNALRGNPLTSFSEQQLLDCCTSTLGYKCQGCNGGWASWTLDYVKKYGVLTESQYPYIGSQGACKATSPTNGFYISSYSSIYANSKYLKAAVVIQPVSVAVHATYWYSYSSGVFNRCSSDPNRANHSVLLVGYTANGEWIVKNSWGATWGQQGYILLASGNTCGVANYGIVAKI